MLCFSHAIFYTFSCRMIFIFLLVKVYTSIECAVVTMDFNFFLYLNMCLILSDTPILMGKLAYVSSEEVQKKCRVCTYEKL